MPPPPLTIMRRPIPGDIDGLIRHIRVEHPEWNRIQCLHYARHHQLISDEEYSRILHPGGTDQIQRAQAVLNAYNMGLISAREVRESLDMELPEHTLVRNEVTSVSGMVDVGPEWDQFVTELLRGDSTDTNGKPTVDDLPCHTCLYKVSKIIDDKYNQSSSGKLLICDKYTELTGRKWTPINWTKMLKCEYCKSTVNLFKEPSRWRRLSFNQE